MPMSVLKTQKKRWKKIVSLVIIGVAVSFVVRSKTGTSGLLFAADMLFAVSMAFFCWGLLCLIRNMGMFDSMVYGTKHLIRLLRRNWKPSRNKEDGYLEYVRSRPRRAEVPTMMLLSVAFVVLSIILSFLAS